MANEWIAKDPFVGIKFHEKEVIREFLTMDQNMLELNRQGYLNGHTPFSALVAFSGIMAARMAGLSYVALSNESSANESTVKGSTVNHQYSKSFKFEEDFHRYEAEYLPGSAYYFSMLRPLSEFQIARFFAQRKQYHATKEEITERNADKILRPYPSDKVCD